MKRIIASLLLMGLPLALASPSSPCAPSSSSGRSSPSTAGTIRRPLFPKPPIRSTCWRGRTTSSARERPSCTGGQSRRNGRPTPTRSTVQFPGPSSCATGGEGSHAPPAGVHVLQREGRVRAELESGHRGSGQASWRSTPSSYDSYFKAVGISAKSRPSSRDAEPRRWRPHPEAQEERRISRPLAK